VGHLDSNKDPLTVLAGIRKSIQVLPDLQLWCCFGKAPLLPEIERLVGNDVQLAERVHFLGKVPHDRIEHLMRAADLFVLGSHREGSGVSVIEALGCGLSPVITDIPSFRMLTGGGTVGGLWSRGDSQHFFETLTSVAQRPRSTERVSARAQFDRQLSFQAVGSKLSNAYRELIERKRTRDVSAAI
jgi:glycosyltransferase involved in cell wall biosynthesis